ncbi:MAG: hypothetical protein ACFCUI_00830 [Bernardetiaceae bacterium]
MALAHAASAFGKMIKEEVIVHHFTVQPKTWPAVDGEFFVLRTDIKGDFAGEVYLVVSPTDEPRISELLLPGSLVGQPEMREAILLEVDNILTAAMVTKYSEILQKQIIGDVPEAQTYQPERLVAYFDAQHQQPNYVFTFAAELITLQSQLKLYIVGFFDERFVQDVQEAITHPPRKKNEAAETYISKTTKGLFRKILPW